jgi:hypothetical protein
MTTRRLAQQTGQAHTLMYTTEFWARDQACMGQRVKFLCNIHQLVQLAHITILLTFHIIQALQAHGLEPREYGTATLGAKVQLLLLRIVPYTSRLFI